MAWKRFWARMIDEVAFAYILFFILDAFFDARASTNIAVELFVQFVVFPAFLIPFEAVQLAIFNRTLGKFLMGIRIETIDCQLSMSLALKRSFLIWWRGLAAGIPILSLIAMGIAYSRYADKGITSWDEELGTRVLARSEKR